MIEAMRQIGEYALEKENKALNDFISILVENPASNETYKHVFCIKLIYDQDFKFNGIEHQQYSKERIIKYLYKKGSSNGPDITPTARVTEIEKTFINKIIGWFSKPLKEARQILDKEDLVFFESLVKYLKDNQNIILSDLKSKINYVESKENSILTLSIEENGLIKYVGDFEVFRKILRNNGASKFYCKYEIISKEKDKVCCVCKSQKEEVYGFVTPYEFYTVDKRGFVSGGFDQSKAWVNNPVCLECALKITAGKDYIEKYMSFNFYGFNFLLIPKMINETNQEDLFDIFEKFNEKKFALSKDYRNFLKESENDILGILSEQDDYLNLNFQFYEKSNSAYRILLYIEDVLPSRLRKIFESKDTVDKKRVFTNYLSNDADSKPIKLTLGNVRWFFPNTLEDPDFNKYFLEITNGIFAGKAIDYNFLLKYIMQRIRKDFRSENSTRYSLLLAFQLLDFLNQLSLLKNYQGGKYVNSKDLPVLLNKIELKEKNGYEQRANIFFSEFETFFNNDAKKAIFLEGALAQYLLNIQKFQRGSTPFRVKLRGLNLNESYIKKIFPEIINKLEEYEANYYTELEALISQYMIQSGNNWKMSNDEISFYFVLGMNMSNLLKPSKSEKEIEND